MLKHAAEKRKLNYLNRSACESRAVFYISDTLVQCFKLYLMVSNRAKSVAVLQCCSSKIHIIRSKIYSIFIKYGSFSWVENSLSRTATLQHCNALAVLDHPQKKFWKKLLKNFRPQCRCRIFAPDLKVKGPADCRQTVVRGLENEGRSKRADVR